MKYHDRMFGMFNRLVRQEDFEGTGAGLAIVKKVVDKMRRPGLGGVGARSGRDVLPRGAAPRPSKAEEPDR